MQVKPLLGCLKALSRARRAILLCLSIRQQWAESISSIENCLSLEQPWVPCWFGFLVNVKLLVLVLDILQLFQIPSEPKNHLTEPCHSLS